MQRCKARLERLVAHEELPKQDPVDWNRARLDHLLVDHMLRSSCLKSATALASATHCEVRTLHALLDLQARLPKMWAFRKQCAVVQALVETHLFNSAKAVFDGLQRRDCSAALQWCSDNSAKLRKQGSKLEFSLHVQVHPHCTAMLDKGLVIPASLAKQVLVASWEAAGHSPSLCKVACAAPQDPAAIHLLAHAMQSHSTHTALGAYFIPV